MLLSLPQEDQPNTVEVLNNGVVEYSILGKINVSLFNWTIFTFTREGSLSCFKLYWLLKQLSSNGGQTLRSSPELIREHFVALRRLERVFRCYIVCETMEDYKEGCLIMVWANYMSPCNSVVGLYFKGTCDVTSITMATHKVHKSVFTFQFL